MTVKIKWTELTNESSSQGRIEMPSDQGKISFTGSHDYNLILPYKNYLNYENISYKMLVPLFF